MNPSIFIDNAFLDHLLERARKNPRLREAFDLRTTPDDQSQRMLNAMLPGTELPIHRHRNTSETAIILRGRMDEVFYDDSGKEIARYALNPSTADFLLNIPAGVWHSVEVLEPTVIFEAKDGPFEPRRPEDILA